MTAKPIEDTRAAQICLSRQIWDSPLAQAAQELVEAVRRPPDPQRAFFPSSFLSWYTRERDGLFRKLLYARGLDLCRDCGELQPAANVQLVLVHLSKVHRVVNGWTKASHDEVVGSLAFIYLCSACRVPTPDETVSITTITGDAGSAVTFRRVYPARGDNGLLVLVDGEEDYRPELPGITMRADETGSEPAMCTTAELADEVGLPPMLHLEHRGAGHAIMMGAVGGRLQLLLPDELADVGTEGS